MPTLLPLSTSDHVEGYTRSPEGVLRSEEVIQAEELQKEIGEDQDLKWISK